MVELSGVRTADLLNAIQALYQLSYSPEVFGFAGRTCGTGRREGGGHYAERLRRSSPCERRFSRSRSVAALRPAGPRFRPRNCLPRPRPRGTARRRRPPRVPLPRRSRRPGRRPGRRRRRRRVGSSSVSSGSASTASSTSGVSSTSSSKPSGFDHGLDRLLFGVLVVGSGDAGADPAGLQRLFRVELGSALGADGRTAPQVVELALAVRADLFGAQFGIGQGGDLLSECVAKAAAPLPRAGAAVKSKAPF